jgi:hypothetical protein
MVVLTAQIGMTDTRLQLIIVQTFLYREQYHQQTGLDVDTSSFRAPGAHTAYANTVRSFNGRLVSRASGGVEKEAIFDFDFTKEPYDGDGREAVQSAILKAYWKPNLAIKRSTGKAVSKCFLGPML